MRSPFRIARAAAASYVGVALALAGCSSTMPRAFVDADIPVPLRVALLPLANYTDNVNASDRVLPALAVELSRQRDVEIIDPGIVENVIGDEPWLLLDRVPPDVLERFGEELGASGLILGSVLACGYRAEGSRRIPEFAVTLRLLEIPGGRLLWSVMHARNGSEGESVFGIGRIESLERLVSQGAKEIIATFPTPSETEKEGSS